MQNDRLPRPAPRALSALLIDDDPFMLTVLGDMLRDLGHTGITTATNGFEALKALEGMSVQPELIFCDLNMPANDGFQFMEHLGQRRFGGSVVLVSGMDQRTMRSAELMARFHRLKMLTSLTKPVAESALRAALAPVT